MKTSGSTNGTALGSRPEQALRRQCGRGKRRGAGRAGLTQCREPVPPGLPHRPPLVFFPPSLGRRLRDWKLHQAHPDCRAGHHLFHPAAAAGAGGGDPSGAVAGDRQSHQGRDRRGQAGLPGEKWCLEGSLAAIPPAPRFIVLPPPSPRERGSLSVYACGGSCC